MIFDILGIHRKIQTSMSNLADGYRKWPDCIQEYKCPTLTDAWEYEYSKTKAIHDLCQAIRDGIYNHEQADLLKALLTDHGLLFPQTRERWYEPSDRSMRQAIPAAHQQHLAAAKMFCSDTPLADPFWEISKNCYDDGLSRFYEQHDVCIPFITWEEAQRGLKTLMEGREGPFAIKEISKEFAWGSLYPKIRKQSYGQNPAEVERLMAQWIDHAILTWEDGEEFMDSRALRTLLKFSTIQLYEFLAYIARHSLLKTEQYKRWSNPCYEPSLNNSQLDAFSNQIQ